MTRLLPLLLLTATPALAAEGDRLPDHGTRLDIVATGEVQRTPDVATIGAGVVTQTSQVNLQPQYRYGDNQPPVLTGYQVANRVTVRLRDLKNAGRVLDALVAAGANQIDGPTFGVDKPEAALDEARTQAIATARARAELYAKAAGLKVVRIARISESGQMESPIRPMAMVAMRNKAADTPV